MSYIIINKKRHPNRQDAPRNHFRFSNKDEYANSTQAEGILQARCLNRDYQDQQRDKNMFRLHKTGLPFLVASEHLCLEVWPCLCL